MSRHFTRDAIAEHGEVHADLLHPVVLDRTFELPKILYAACAALYLGFIAVMALGFSDPGLIIPLTVCTVFMVMFFAVPTAWVRMTPDTALRDLGWDRFRRQGIATLTGRISAGEAAAQMLVLPVLIFLWALACVTIAALV
ncbi:hypothetical protein ACWPM1_05650 [Tsuneonella sp. HG249]